MDKYELTNRSKVVETPYGEAMVYQIKALIDLPDIGVKAGDLGGYIGSEDCLGQINDCWVFEGSSVTKGSRVVNRSQIKGTSLVTGNSVIRGTCLIEDSEILSGTKVQGSSHIMNSDLSINCIVLGKSRIENSRLRNVKLANGKIVNSTIQSFSDNRLTFEKCTVIDACQLDVYADNPFVMKGIQMRNVTGIDIIEFTILEKTLMTNLVFEGESAITVGKPNSPMTNTTSLIGGEAGLTMDGAELVMINSSVIGDGLLKGKIELENSHVSDFISVINEMEEGLHLLNTTVRECASLYKSSLMGRTTISNQDISGDVVVKS